MGILSIHWGKEFLCLRNHDNTCISGLQEDLKVPIINIRFYSRLYKNFKFKIKLKYTFVLGQLNLNKAIQENKIAGLSSRYG